MLRSWAGLVLAGLLLCLAGERTAHAQGFPFFPANPYANPAPAGRPSYYPGAPAYPDARRPSYREERRARRPVYREERQARRPAYRAERAPRRPVRAAPAAEARKAQPEKPAIEPSTYIVVFGDSLADLIADGLDDAYDEAPEIEVVSKAKGDSGLVRNDAYDWPKVIQDYLNGNPQITFAVMMVGVNDRQAIREGEAAHDPLSDRWRDIYRDRVDAVAQAFADRKIPLLWVSAPPTKNEKFSADMAAMNEIFRERVQKAGGVYVDIWPGFVNDENRYAPVGPDVDGQTARLRAADGIHFTSAGARKAAHFAEVEIKRLLEARSGASVAAPAPQGSGRSPDARIRRIAAAACEGGRRTRAALDAPGGLPGRRPRRGPAIARQGGGLSCGTRVSSRGRARPEAGPRGRFQVAAVVATLPAGRRRNLP